MNTNKEFDSFNQAKEFAKDLASKKRPHKIQTNNGKYIVFYKSNNSTNSTNIDKKTNDNTDDRINALKLAHREETNNLYFQISTLQSRLKELRAENESLRFSIDGKVQERVKSVKESLEEDRLDLRRQQKACSDEQVNNKKLLGVKSRELSKKNQELETIKKKFLCLQDALIERYGKVDIIETKSQVSNREICQRCGGDGGVNGGCSPCSGTGWAESVTEKTEYKTEFD